MSTEDQYFYEDEVFRINKRGFIEFGMVLENSELFSSDDNSDCEEVSNGRVKRGHIRVAWHPTGAEEVVSERKVGLADRSLMPGDVVRRMIKGKDTQRGYCRHMKVTASIQIVGTKNIIIGIDSTNLKPIEQLSPDLAVCLDSWVGGIKVVHLRLFLRLPDNSRCIVSNPETSGFDIFDEKNVPDAEFPHRGDYYPGQVLWGPLSLLEDIAEWPDPESKERVKLLKTKVTKNVKVVVEGVEPTAVAVHWQCRAYSKDGACSEKEQPNIVIVGDDVKRLKLLSVFEPCTLQVGDRHTYVIQPSDNITTREKWRREQKRIILKSNRNADLKIKHKKSSKNEIVRLSYEEVNGHSQLTESEVKSPDKDATENSPSEWCSESSDNESETASNTSSASAISNPGSKKLPSFPIRAFMKELHKRKLRRSVMKKPLTHINLNPGYEVVVETISTSSTADVVWQDGSVESGIPSTELYPIHHLDDQEFFPGDFVIENREDASNRVYGVVQNVDHAGRTAAVKWFKTYASSDNPCPMFLIENEVSVYDLKDHPDFQYRPGTVVIRVANFQGEDEACTAGQVLDNYPEGRVRVWWVEGHVSMCWPQDLYKVGEYDSDAGDFWDDGTSDDGSWQTESEISNDETTTDEVHDESLKPKLAANIERARVAMSRLEEIFTQNPSLQTAEVMRKLLDVYKDCRYLDKLMGTLFFHESHFQGLLERVRERGRTNLAQKVADQVSRLFSHSENSDVKVAAQPNNLDDSTGEEKFHKRDISGEFLRGSLASLEARVSIVNNHMGNGTASSETTASPIQSHHPLCMANVCVRLCSLILAQLVKAHAEVIRRFGDNTVTVSDVSSNVSPSSETNQESITEPANANANTNSIDEAEQQSGTTTNETNLPETLSVDSIVQLTEKGVFSVMDTAPNSHKYKLTLFQPTEAKSFFRRVREEIKLLKNSLPAGTWVTTFEDRMDLFSVMIRGPEKTPYEDGLFFFDFQLSPDYPKTPPNCHYISYCSDRLNPNLYEDGKVCVSLLGTWSGKGTEMWTSSSNLLQVIVSIQGLILVSEPYFNEAGYEKQRGSQQGRENSRMYNEMVVLKLVQAMTKLVISPHLVFKMEIERHFAEHSNKLCERLESWMDISEKYNNACPLSPTTPTTTCEQLLKEVSSSYAASELPDFPLIPASKGFCITLRKTLVTFRSVLEDCQRASEIVLENSSAETKQLILCEEGTLTKLHNLPPNKPVEGNEINVKHSQSHFNEASELNNS